MDAAYEAAALGDVVGPYEFNGSQSIGKVIGFTSDTINARHHSAVERCAEDVSHLVQWRQMRMVCQSKEGPVPLDQKFTEGILVLWQLESAMKS